MLIQDFINFKTFNIISEFFFCITILYLLFHSTIVAYTKNAPIIINTIISISILILFFLLLLILKDTYTYNLEWSIFQNSIKIDSIGGLAKKCIVIFSIICLYIIKQYIYNNKINNFEYLIIILFSILGLLVLSSSNNLITAYLAIELQSLAFYVLASFKKNSNFSIDAGVKYFILGAVSSNLFLFGSSFIYGLTGSTNFDDFYYLFSFSPQYNVDSEYLLKNFYCFGSHSINHDNLMKLALSFIFASLFFKLALSPFYIWIPDVYEGSPTSSTAFFSTIPKLGIFIFLIKFFYYCFYCFFESWRQIIVIVAILSIVIGSFAGLEQRKLKSLLAYSSINHMGYSLIAFSTGTWTGIKMLLSYLIIYLGSSLTIWSIFIFTQLKNNASNKHNKDLADLILLNKSNKQLAICFMILLFSIAGFPPMIGFLVKINVFLSAITISSYYIAIIGILCSVVSTFYYLRLIKIIYFEQNITGNLYNPIKTDSAAIIAIFFYLLIFLFINPSLFYLNIFKTSYNFYNLILLT